MKIHQSHALFQYHGEDVFLFTLQNNNGVEVCISNLGAIIQSFKVLDRHHNPIDIEHKKMEFDGAKNGTIGLETAFGVLTTVLPLEKVIEKLTAGKRTFSIENATIKEGSIANITLFNPKETWTFNKENILSKSKNSAFIGIEMKGKVYGIYNQGKLVLN